MSILFRRIPYVMIAVVAAVLLIAPFVVLAAPGDLDTSFDGDGIVTTPIGSGQDLAGSEIAIQADGKLIQVGRTTTGPGNNDFTVVRYNADGSLDTTFDGDGIVTLDWGGNDFGETVALQADGKIVVVGYSNVEGDFDFAVARYNADGTLDTSFDGDGLVTTAIGTLHDRAYGVDIQADGKIVVAGYGRGPASGNNDFVVVRYNPDGSLDTTFDTDGMVITSLNGTQDQIYRVAVQPDGKILALGYSNGVGTYDFTLVRYNADGSLDTTFDTDGIVSTDISGVNEFAYGLALQPDGKIVAAGYVDPSGTANNSIAVVRYNSDGSLDSGFGTAGIVTEDIGVADDTSSSTVMQPDGKIIVAGRTNTGTFYDFALLRYNDDGTLDSDFGTGGVVTTTVSSNHDSAQSVTLQSDGKIVVGGNTNNGSDNDFAVVRYLGTELESDLTVEKSGSPDPVVAGETLTYTVTITNQGPADAMGVVVTDTLPTGVSNAATMGCDEDPGGVPNCALGTIAAGSSATYTMTVTVDGDVSGTLTNEVEVGADSPLINTDDDAASVTTTVTAASDLTIEKSGNPDPVVAGETLTYTVTITNQGPSNAVGVTVTDTLPSGVSNAATMGCDEDPGGVPNCTLGTIAAGSSATYTMTVTVDGDASGTLINEVEVGADSPLINTDDDTASVTTTVTAAPFSDLTISMSDSPDPVIAGTTLTYVITVTNQGPADATGVAVTSTLPAGVSNAATTGCDEDPGGVPTCTLGTITAGSSATYTTSVTVGSDTIGTLTHEVEVSAQSALANTGDDTATVTTEVDFVYYFPFIPYPWS